MVHPLRSPLLDETPLLCVSSSITVVSIVRHSNLPAESHERSHDATGSSICSRLITMEMTVRRLLSWIESLTGSLILLLGVLLFLLTTPPGERLLRDLASRQLSSLFNLPVTIGELETNLVSHLTLKDFSIRQKTTSSGLETISIDRMELTYSLAGLLRRNLRINSLSLDSLRVVLERDSTGQLLNLPSFPAPDTTHVGSAESPQWNVSLDQVRLRDGFVRYQDQQLPLHGEIDGLDASLFSSNTTHWRFQTRATSLSGLYRELPVFLNGIVVTGEYTGETLRVDTLGFSAPGFEISGQGGLDLAGERDALTAQVTITGSPEILSNQFADRLGPLFVPVRGDVSLSLSIDGTLANPRLLGDLEYSHLIFPRAHLQQGRMNAMFQRHSLHLNSYTTEYENGRIALSGYLRLDSLLTHALDIQLESVDLGRAWSELYHAETPYQGVVRGGLISSGPLLVPRLMDVRGDLALEHVRYREQPLPDFTAAVRSNAGTASIRIRQAASALDLRLKYGQGLLLGDFDFRVDDLAPLVELANISELKGRLQASGTIEGSTSEPHIEARIQGDRLLYRNFPVDSLRGSVTYDKGNILLGKTIARSNPVQIDTSQPPFGFPGIEGTYSYFLTAQGTLNNPEVSLLAHVGMPRYGDHQADGLHLSASLADSILQVNRLQVIRDSLLLRIKGSSDLTAKKGDAVLDLFQIPDQPITFSFPSPEVDRPDGFTSLGSSSGWFEWPAADSIILALQGHDIHTSTLTSLLPAPPDLAGILAFQASFAGSIRSPGGEVSFSVASPRYQNVEMDSLRGDIQLNQDLLDLRNLEVFFGENRSWASLRIGLHRNEEGLPVIDGRSYLSGRSEASQIDMLLFNPFLKQKVIQAGRSTYRLKINGTVKRPRLEGDLVVRQGRFRLTSETPEVQNINLRAVLRDSVLTLDSLRGSIADAKFNLQGSLTHRNWESFQTSYILHVENREVFTGDGQFTTDYLDLRLVAKGLNLSMLQPFTPGVRRLQGLFRSTLTIRGPTDNPDIDGDVLVRGLTIHPAGMESAITQGTIKLRFDRKKVVLDTLSFALDQGRFHADGTLSHDKVDLTGFDLRGKGQNLQLRQQGHFLLTVKQTELRLTSSGERYLLDGDLYLGECGYYRRFQPWEIVELLRESGRPKPEMNPFLKRTDLNVRIRESNQTWVDNNLARIRLNLDLAFLGNLERLSMNGRARVEEGYVFFLDRRFRVETGVLDFASATRINPIVDLHAESALKPYQTSDGKAYTITLKVQGDVEQAVVTLTSDPPQSESDIISLLTVGATREQLAGRSPGGTTMADILRQRAEDLSSQRISGYVSRKVGTAFGLEQMSVEGNLFNVNRSWGPQLLASKRLTDRMEVTYTTRVGHMNEQGIKLDYRLSRYFSVEGQTDQTGQTGLDLIYKVRFK